MDIFDYNGIFSSVDNSNGDQSIDTLDNKAFKIISQIEPKLGIDISSILFNENQNQTETNYTSKENEIIDIIHETKQIEMICPFIRRKIFRKRFRRKELLRKKKINFVD